MPQNKHWELPTFTVRGSKTEKNKKYGQTIKVCKRFLTMNGFTLIKITSGRFGGQLHILAIKTTPVFPKLDLKYNLIPQ